MKNQQAFEVEKGIPIPPRGKNAGVTNILRQMKPGESFWTNGTAQNVLYLARQTGIKITTRAEVKDGKAGCRIWRLK